ncbi:MAG: ABC transporter permease [Armatimonadetes bacterium]|nr:ABC transporter permease [Armatimonadota bacterium]
MTQILTIAGLTVKEALRKRVFIGGLVISVLFLLLLYIPRVATRGRHGSPIPVPTQVMVLAFSGLGMIKFFGAVLGVTLAAGSVSSEVERGTLYTVLPKPIRRSEVMMGKWLGLICLSMVNMLIWTAILWAAVYSRNFEPNLWLLRGAAVALLYPVMFVTLTLLFSTFCSNVLATGLALISAGVGWQEGMMRDMGIMLQVDILKKLAVIAGYTVPIGRLSRWINRAAELEMPFRSRLIPEQAVTNFDLAYVVAYIFAVLLLAFLVFQWRDV